MFDLETALAAWRRSLEHHSAFDAEDLDELERHVRDQVAVLVARGATEQAAFGRAMGEMGRYAEVETEYRKVYWSKLRRRRRVGEEIGLRIAVLKNYLKIALRHAKRNAGYTFINVFGLAVGMAFCLLILLYVREERSYDRHHPDHERIYRVALEISTPTSERIFANGPPTLAAAITETFPEVEEAVRLWSLNGRLVFRNPDERFFEDNFFFADPAVFNLFYLPLEKGSPETVLSRPQTVVLSARMARKYFGEENPLGMTLSINDREFEVTGVLRELPQNSHVTFDFISSILPVEQQNDWFRNWHLTMFHTYVKLRPGADVPRFQVDVATLAERYVADDLSRFQQEYRYFLQPISQIHLRSDLRSEINPPGNELYLYVFSVVAILILLIASLNYINLTTAQAATRAREVGVRKVVGSGRRQLMRQFLCESFGVAVAALFLAVALVVPLLSVFNAFTGHNLALNALLEPGILAGLFALPLITGLLAGFFPAFVLSSMHPLRVITGRFRSSTRGIVLRKVLVTGQFAISLILIVGSITAFRQLEYMKHNDLGFDEEQIVVLPTRGAPIAESFEEIKAEWLRDPSVRAATVSSSVPGRGVNNYAIELLDEAERKNQSMYYLFVDFEFVSTYDIEMVAGRPLQRKVVFDRDGAFLLNEAGVRAFGWQTPEAALGKRVQTGFGGRHGEIVGVYRDFNFRSLHAPVEPLMLAVAPPQFRYVSLKVGTADLPATLALIERTWHRLFPDRPYEYFFLDEDFDRQYEADEKTALLMLIFAGLAVLIACLGLFGLAAFAARSFTKEIGIRKVLGASVGSIVRLLTRDFARLVVTAVVIGTPVAWFAVTRWLSTFAYRTEVSWAVFAAAGAAALGIALITVSYQALRAGLADPVKSLRYE